MTKRIAAILVVYMLLAGCSSQNDERYQKDGVQYGITKGTFRGRWWSYYERGSSYLAGKYYNEAMQDFRTALDGRAKDTWRARTYGLHFVEYFPNREIGVTYYQQGNLEEAERYLTLSLGQIDTERARYFLDQVKKARIANGSLKDDSSPEIDTTFTEGMVIASNLPPVGPAPMTLAPAEPEKKTEAAPVPAKPAAKAPAAKPAPKPEAKKATPAPKPADKPVATAKAEPKPAAKPAEAPKPAAKAETKPAEPAKPAPAKPAEPAKVAEAPKSAPAPAAKPAEAPKPVEAPKPAAKPVEATKPAPTPAPAPAPALPADTKIITEPVIPVEIATKDDVGVIKVAVNGKQLPQRGSATQLKFRDDIQVKEGAQTIQVIATDLADKQTTKQVNVVVDMTGPTIGVFSPIEPTVTPEGAVTLDGASTDNVGVATVAVGERRIADAQGSKKLPFNASLPLGNGENVFVVAARDTGGNETRSAVKVFRGDPNSREAKLWLLREKRRDLFLFASNGTGDLDELLRIAQNESKKPINEIRLKSPSMEKPYRGNRTLRISGDVVTSSAVQSLMINGVAVNEISGAPKESFNRRVPIDPELFASGTGTMDISIVAVTTGGETLEKNFTVNLAPVDIASPASRMPVAVLAFAGVGVDTAVSDSLRAATEQQIIDQERFRAVGKDQLLESLDEQQVSAALGNPDEAINLGKQVPAQIFLVGDLFPHDANGLEIKARAVTTGTGELVGTLDVFIDDKSNAELVQTKCAELASQLAALYPRLSGEVVSVNGNQVTVSLGAEDGARPGAYVLLLQQTEPWLDPATGEVLEPGELREAGRALIESVSPNDSRTVIIERKEEGAPVEQGMPAITM